MTTLLELESKVALTLLVVAASKTAAVPADNTAGKVAEALVATPPCTTTEPDAALDMASDAMPMKEVLFDDPAVSTADVP